jgi:hypothetical protein
MDWRRNAIAIGLGAAAGLATFAYCMVIFAALRNVGAKEWLNFSAGILGVALTTCGAAFVSWFPGYLRGRKQRRRLRTTLEALEQMIDLMMSDPIELRPIRVAAAEKIYAHLVDVYASVSEPELALATGFRIFQAQAEKTLEALAEHSTRLVMFPSASEEPLASAVRGAANWVQILKSGLPSS